jgi:hypothetical protein
MMNYDDELENSYREVRSWDGLMSKRSICKRCAWLIDANTCDTFEKIPDRYKAGEQLHLTMENGELLTWVPKVHYGKRDPDEEGMGPDVEEWS